MSTEFSDFSALKLVPALLDALSDTGYTRPTPIQSKVIPVVLKGGDLLAEAHTGSGKTAGFTLPVLQQLSQSRKGRTKPGQPRCLVLTPTRELATQVAESVKTYGKYLPLKSLAVAGGVKINPQRMAMRKPVDILIATPGRLLDLHKQNIVRLFDIDILILDEADRMLDMGFIDDIQDILRLLPAQRQSLLFSATFSSEIRQLARTILDNPAEISAAAQNATAELVQQVAYLVDQGNKRRLLTKLLAEHTGSQALVFTRTKNGANRLVEKLGKSGIQALAIHGDKSQGARNRALMKFKDGSLHVMVATDLAARGIDIDNLPIVVNYELPHVCELYVHRIGRTGRAGKPGLAISLVNIDELKHLRDIEKHIGDNIACIDIEGYTGHDELPGTAIVDKKPRAPRRRKTGQKQVRPKK
ncbi:MAG: DEAD/DEAH box helicase [Granulosicoccus sp.]